MVSLKAFALTAVAVAALTGAATAADLLPPPPAMEPPPPAFSEGSSGWYLRGDVGVGVNNSLSARTSPNPLNFAGAGSTDDWSGTNLSESGMIDIGVGYQVNNWFRADVTGELRGGASFSGLEVVNSPIAGASAYPFQSQYADFYRGNLSTTLAMANAYVDMGTWYGLSPYVGAGVGVAFNRFSGGVDNGSNNFQGSGGYYNSSSGGILGSATQVNLAWALMAGVDMSITHNLKLELGYRYLNYGNFKSGTSQCLAGGAANGSFSSGNCSGGGYRIASTKLSSNDFRLGLRYYLDAPSPVQDFPLVRKY